jgi:hypothetical protein
MNQRSAISMAGIMEGMEQSDPGMKACWSIISRGANYDMLDYDTLREVIEHLERSEDYINEELGFETTEGGLRVSLLDDQAFCDLQGMISQLRELKSRYEAALKDRRPLG